ncbi:hypothetical protein TrCOL_g9341 [Triparma columacea]|uniref:Uncharacterized protein n=1 Tax=Triparma columacea TaxID=722753 RepID=A0A9W7GIU0_9STRA|nr:hypothetical protein TrCOL_g9341 [Triparma columacea]
MSTFLDDSSPPSPLPPLECPQSSMFVLPLPYIDMYSQYATTCLILAVKHEVVGEKDGKPVGACGMAHIDNVPSTSSIVSSLMSSALPLLSSSVPSLSTSLYMVGAFDAPSEIKRSVVSELNAWILKYAKIANVVVEPGTVLSSPPPPDPGSPSPPCTWRVKVEVDKTELDNCDYRAVTMGGHYRVSCLYERGALKDRNVVRLNSESAGRGGGVVLPFPIYNGIFIDRKGGYELLGEGVTIRQHVKELIDGRAPGDIRRNMYWLAEDDDQEKCEDEGDTKGGESLFKIVGGELTMMVPSYSVTPSHPFVSRLGDALDSLDAGGGGGDSDKMRIGILNICSTSPWCEGEGFLEKIKEGIKWWKKGGDDCGGVYKWGEEDGWRKVEG